MHLDESVPFPGSDCAQTHLSQMFTAIISNLDRNSRETLCHVLHHCHTRLSPHTHLPIMFFSERDDVTYATAAPHLVQQQDAMDPPNSKLCRSGRQPWSDAHEAAERVLNSTCLSDVNLYNQLCDIQHEEVQSASRASRRQRESYDDHAPQSTNDSDSEEADDFDDELSYDSYISDSQMSDVTEEAEDYEQRCTRPVFAHERESQAQCSRRH